MWFAWEGLVSHAPSDIKPTDEQLSDWAQKSSKVIQNNKVPCQ